jgi:hypothetical protein
MKIISGGQTGADQAGWRAAKRFGLETGGWMPRGFKTEAGPRPEFARLYGAQEHPSPEYPARTTSNVGLADMTFLFGNPSSPGGKLVHRITNDIPTHLTLTVESPNAYRPQWSVGSIRRWGGIKAINVAGNRESSFPGIGAWVEEYLCEVFRALGYAELPPAGPDAPMKTG